MALSKIQSESVNLADNFAGMRFGGTTSANALADYEEGTWTPTYTGGAGAITITSYALQSAVYTKVGRVVYIQGVLRTNGISGVSSGTYDIAGLPFNVAANLESSTTNASNIMCSTQSAWTNAPQNSTPTTNTTTTRGRQGMNVGAAGYTNGDTGDFVNGTNKNRVYFSGWYETDA